MSKSCSCCDDLRNNRRDFRQSKGDGPEEMPHRKKGRGKKFCKKNKGDHVYDEWTEWSTYATWRYRYRMCKCGKRGYGTDGGYQSQRLVEYTYTDSTGAETKRSHWT